MALSDNLSVLFRIKGDSSDAVKAVKNVEGAVGNLRGVASAAASGDISGLASSFTGLVAGLGPVGIAAASAGAALAAMGGVAVTVTSQLFELANQAAEFGSQIYDATVQTGLSAEALSSLKVAAAQSDVEFSKVIQSVTKFSLLVGDAAKGSATAEASLKKFGLTSKDAMGDVEGSFAKVVKKIAELPPGIERTNLAAEAFGSRGGKDMLKLIDQMDGDLPGLISKMKELGMTIDDKTARAADNFADKMTMMGMRLEMLKVKVGMAVMPAFERFFNALDGWVTENQGAFDQWAARVGTALDNVVKGFLRVATFIKNNWDWLKFVFFGPAGLVIGDAFIAKLDQQIEDQGGGPKGNEKGGMARAAGTPNPNPPGGGRTGGVRSGQSAADKKKEEERKKKEEEAIKRRDETEKIRLDMADLKDRVERTISDFEKSFEIGVIAGDTSVAGGFIYPDFKKFETDTKNAVTALEARYAELKIARDRLMTRELSDTDLTEQQKNNIKERYRQEDVAAEIEKEEKIARIRKVAADQAYIDTKRNQDEIFQEQADYWDRQIQLIEQSTDAEEVKASKIKKIRIGMLELEAQFYQQLAALEENDAARKQMLIDKYDELIRKIRELQGIPDKDPPAPKTEPPNGFLDGVLEGLGKSPMIDDVTGKLEIMKGLGEMLSDTFAKVAQGLGNMVQQWVLTGEVGPRAMRKLTASILAGLAAQAAVEALMETARGFANLAKFWTTGIPSYLAAANLNFTSAAVFASIAGVAAVAGRAIAGDSFKEQSNTATGQNSNRNTDGQGLAYSSQGDRTIDGSRSNAPAFRPEIVINDRSGMFSQLFEAEIRNNSKVRGLIIDTANS